MKESASTNQDDLGKNMLLKTRIFELCNEEYKDLSHLARTREVSVRELRLVHRGKRSINQKLIIEAIKAFPEYAIGELFYFTS